MRFAVQIPQEAHFTTLNLLTAAIDSMSRHVVNNVSGLWGMQVADIQTGQIVSANIPAHSTGESGLLHGIGWTPDESEVWESSSYSDPHIYIWSMLDPMAPKLISYPRSRARVFVPGQVNHL